METAPMRGEVRVYVQQVDAMLDGARGPTPEARATFEKVQAWLRRVATAESKRRAA